MYSWCLVLILYSTQTLTNANDFLDLRIPLKYLINIRITHPLPVLDLNITIKCFITSQPAPSYQSSSTVWIIIIIPITNVHFVMHNLPKPCDADFVTQILPS